MAEIVLAGVTKRYPDGTEAVQALDLEIADGEFVILVGPSGCGKSTALRMIAGLEEISDGELRIGDAVVNDLPPRDRDIAMVFQNYALYPHMTVRENMGFALKMAKVDKAEIERKVEEVAQTLDLVEHLDRKPANLSGGQRQRVAMGRAIVREPKAFLMDEPLSNLDAKLRVQMRLVVAQLQKRLGTTTVYVTHDQTEAMTLGDRVAVLRRGLLQQYDTPKALYDGPANLFVAGFIGSPAMNFFGAQVSGRTLSMPFGDVELPVDPGVSGEVVAGIRPEHFEDAEFAPDGSARKRADVGSHPHGHEFDAPVSLVESMGSEIYVHFSFEGGEVESEELADLAEDAGADTRGRAVARVTADSGVQEGGTVRLWLDLDRIHLFGPDGRAVAGPAAARSKDGGGSTAPAR